MASNTTNVAQSMQGSSLSQFFTTLIVSAVVAAVEIIIFIIVRTIFKRIYEPKTYIGDENRRVEPLPKTPWGWLPALLKMPQEELIRTSGLDAYFFARYLYIHAFFFLSSFVLVGIVLFPIYTVDGKGEAYGKKGLDILTFGNILPSNSSRYIAPLILGYVFIGIYLYILYIEMKIFVRKRQTLLRSPAYQSRASATTILVTAIPKAYMSQEILFRIFNQLPGGVKHIWLNRDLDDLPDKANERTKLVDKLEAIECKLIKTALKTEAKRHKKNADTKVYPIVIGEDAMDRYIPEKKRPTMKIGSIPLLSSLCFGKKVDALTHCKETISKLNTEIEQAKTTLDNYAAINSAFIQFNKPIAAHLAVQSVAASIPLAMTPRYIDIKPTNIVWSNLKLTYYEQKIREIAVFAATAVLIVFWAIPVAFVGILSNITYLTEKLTFLQFLNDIPSVVLGLITGLLPTILLSILMALLPIILRLFAKTTGIPTTDAIDRYVQGSYFVFQVVHAFLFVTISSSVSSVIVMIIQNPSSAAIILAANIPTASNFFFSFLALQGLTMAPSLLLQIATLILFYLLGKLFDNTPRKKWKRYFTLSSLNWGTIFPVFTNFIVITLVYSIIAPLMLLISGLAFGLFYIAYAYTMFYVTDFPNDAGGLAFPRAIYQSFTGIYLMEIMLATLFFLAQNDSGSQSAIVEAIFMCVSIAITVAVQYTMCTSFDPLTYYLPIDAEEFSQLDIPVSGKFGITKKVTRILNHRQSINDSDSVSTVDQAVNEVYDNTMENAYLHPALRDPKPIIWIPRDNLGIAVDEVQKTEASGMNILMSTEGARFNDKVNIEINGAPPDHMPFTETNQVRTRF
ncbi:unnamed protein product [Adineta steineri]|uniref:DUF221-domain-containing protein n=1 Tax=Adineta steineri TaxID=433720 RepID=A0A819LLS5_9BILA|nr:unnamed protein product [Adineta steineri]CAF3968165.1 unnamed protein product [Adineta steineri]